MGHIFTENLLPGDAVIVDGQRRVVSEVRRTTSHDYWQVTLYDEPDARSVLGQRYAGETKWDATGGTY